MKTGERCPTCGEEPLIRGMKDVHRTVGGVVYEGTIPADVWPNSDEAITFHDDLVHFDAAVTLAVMASGADDGATMAWLRKRAGLRALDLAELLDVTPETVSRWENEAHAPAHAQVVRLARLALDAQSRRQKRRTHSARWQRRSADACRRFGWRCRARRADAVPTPVRQGHLTRLA